MSDTIADIRLQPHALRVFRAMAVIGGLSLIAGLVLSPQRAWANLLVLSIGTLGLGLGGAVFLAVHRLAGAAWATALRRVPESMVTLLPVGGIGLLAVLVFRPSLYGWVQPSVELEHLMVGFKGFWLQRPFFLARAVFYLILWTWLGTRLVQLSRGQDLDPSDDSYSLRGRYSAILAASFLVTYCLASFDWIMSIEPEWFSTVFGFYNIAGLFVAVLSLMTLVSIWLRRRGDFRAVLHGEHLHDLGKLLMGFTTVWAYLWFCQYMLIWYANFPEETGHYLVRREGAWNSVFFLNLIVNWVLPFLLLLPASVKRSSSAMAKIACLLLVGRVVDLYLMIEPSIDGIAGPSFGVYEVGPLVGAIGVIALLVVRGLRSAAIVPANDPRLEQSLHYHS
jgi:hypothetical protein